MGSEERTIEEVGCGRNDDVKMDEWSHKLDSIRNERIRGTTNVGEISKKVQECRLKWYGHVLVERERGDRERERERERGGERREREKERKREREKEREREGERERERERERGREREGERERERGVCIGNSTSWITNIQCAKYRFIQIRHVSVITYNCNKQQLRRE